MELTLFLYLGTVPGQLGWLFRGFVNLFASAGGSRWRPFALIRFPVLTPVV